MDENFSHSLVNYSEHELIKKIGTIKKRLKQGNLVSGYHYDDLAYMVDELACFDLGRFMLINQGIDGYWTDYAINLPRDIVAKLSEMEQILFNSRVMKATYQRQQIFKRESQKKVKNANHLAAIPSGLMSELLDLDYSNINNIEITAVDLDAQSLPHSQQKYPN